MNVPWGTVPGQPEPEHVSANSTPIHPDAIREGGVVIADGVVVQGINTIVAARDRGETNVPAYILNDITPDAALDILRDDTRRGYLWPTSG